MHCYILGIGSNCCDRRLNVEEAIRWLNIELKGMVVSEIYETPAAGKCSYGSPYLNAVVKGFSELRVFELEAKLKEYELAHGRDEASRKACRVSIDIDIVCCDACVLRKWDYSQTFFRLGYHQISKL